MLFWCLAGCSPGDPEGSGGGASSKPAASASSAIEVTSGGGEDCQVFDEISLFPTAPCEVQSVGAQ